MRLATWVAAFAAAAIVGHPAAHGQSPPSGTGTKKPAARKPIARAGAASLPSKAQAEPAANAAPAQTPTPPAPSPTEDELRKQRAELEALRNTTRELLRTMVREGVLTREKADALLGEPGPAPSVATSAENASAPPAPLSPSGEAGNPRREVAPTGETPPSQRRKRSQTVRVPYVPEAVKNEIRDQIKHEVLAQAKAERWAEPGALPEWLDRIAWEGDLRLRYQGEYYADDNVTPNAYTGLTGRAINNTQTDRDLWRMRVRLGMLAKLGESLGVGIRIATGSLGNPVSTNVTLGRTNRPYELLLDRAYLKWDPSDRWSVSGGRMPNPWYWPTDLVWDEDLNFDGVAATFKPPLSPSSRLFATAGVFPLQSAEPTPVTPDPRAKWLYGVQVGGDWRPESGSRFTLAAGLYDFRRIEGRPNTVNSQANDWTAAQALQKGNTLFDINAGTGAGTSLYGLASKFRVLNIGGEAEFGRFDPFFVKVSADYAKNLGFDAAEILARTRTPVSEATDAYQVRVTFGRDAIRARNDWQVFAGYRHVERDAVLDAFTDSGFYNGGTNTKGYVVGAFYGLERNAFLRVRYMSGRPVDTFNGALRLGIDVLHTDFNVRF